MGSDELSQRIKGSIAGDSAGSLAMEEDLLNVANRLKQAWPPLTPSLAFQVRLKERLMAEPRPVTTDPQITVLANHSRELVLGAAVLSIAGAAVFLWRSRMPVPSESHSARIA